MAPNNMNAYAERFARTVRKEALNNFIIFSEAQLRNIMKDFITYYNKCPPHQGIGQKVPTGYDVQTEREVAAFPVLSGLHHHYERRKAS